MQDLRLDPEIEPLVEAMRTDDSIETLGSCCGHGREPAYVDLAVHGIEGLASFVANMNRLDRHLEGEVFLDLSVNWSEEVATACDFAEFPNWIMLSLRILGRGDAEAPTAEDLSKMAQLWGSAGPAVGAGLSSLPWPHRVRSQAIPTPGRSHRASGAYWELELLPEGRGRPEAVQASTRSSQRRLRTASSASGDQPRTSRRNTAGNMTRTCR